MKQLRPRNILAIGIGASLILSLATVYLTFYAMGEEFQDWRIAPAIAGIGWLFFGVPTFLGLALIRHRIGRGRGRGEKIRTASRCWIACLLLATVGIGTGFYIDYSDDAMLVRAFALLAGTVSATIFVLTTLNIVFRFANNDWMAEIASKGKSPVSKPSLN